MLEFQEFLRELGRSLSEFLDRELPQIGATGWWERSVLPVLTPIQLENVKRRGITSVSGLDLAALLRVLDQNWYDISTAKNWPREVRNFIKETHSIRNRWAHAGSHSAPEEDTYRDLDTMHRLADALGDSALAERLGRAKRNLLQRVKSEENTNSRHSAKSENGKLRDGPSDGVAARRPALKHGQNAIRTNKGLASRVDLALVGCVKTKLEGRHKAKDLFISPLFIGRRARAETLGAPWFVLSAKFGLLAPDREVDTYDVSLNSASSTERRQWSARVLGQLRESFGSVEGKTVEVHAGANYRNFGLVQGLRSQGARVIVPLEHARQGEQLAWYNDQARNARGDFPPSSHNVTPKAQLAPAPAGSQPSGCAVELLSVKSLPQFSYRWPVNVEEFTSGWEMQVRHDGHIHRLRLGIGHRQCFGRDRVHTVVWLDGHPMVEGAEAEDYPVTGDLVSVLKVFGGNRDAKSLDEVDPAYSSFRVERHCDAIEGRNARNGLAVRIGRDDFQSWAHHALLRAQAKGSVVSKSQVGPKLATVESASKVDAGTRKRVAASLLEFGRSLATGQPSSFTPDSNADAFVRTDAFAFLVAVICDEQVRFEAAWEAPHKLKERLGHWDIRRIAGERDSVRTAFAASPALHRWVSVTANRVIAAAERVISRYRGDASLIWSDEPSAEELRERFELFEGIGQKKSAMAVE